MAQSRHTFTHLDSDTDQALGQPGRFDAAVNLALEQGYVTAQTGNVLVSYDLPPVGTTRSLGSFEDGATGTAVALLYNSLGRHRLVRYDPTGNAGAGSLVTLLEWAGLGLSADLVLQGGVVDGLLLYLGADGYLRSVNLARVAAGYYTPARLAANPLCLHLVKAPPTTTPPTASRTTGTGLDTREQLRIIQRRAYQFACRWTYLDGEQTVLSPYSNWVDILEEPSTTQLDTIEVSLPPAPQGVSEVEVLVREPDSDGWQVADTLKPDGNGQLPTTYSFYGVVSGVAVPVAEASRLFESEWPAKAAAAARSRLFTGNLLEGYPTPSPAFTAEVTTDQPGTSTGTLYILTIMAEYPASDPSDPPTEATVGLYGFVLNSGTFPDPSSTYRNAISRPDGKGGLIWMKGTVVSSYGDALNPPPIPNETRRDIQASQVTFVDSFITAPPTTFHENSTYRVAVQFYDAVGKPYGVGKEKSVFIPVRPKGDASLRSIRATLTTTDPLQLNAEIPAGAASYQFVVARNDRTTYFLQGQAADCFAYLGHTITIKSDGTRVEGEKLEDITKTPHQKVWVDIGNFPAAGVGYVWQPGSGDVLRFLNENKEFVITNQVGDYLEVQWTGSPDQSLDGTGQTVARIEIYSPNTTPSPIFYERGPRLPILRQTVNGVEQRSYGTASVLLEGDCFLATLNFPRLDKGKDQNNDDNYQPPNIKSWLPADQGWQVQVESMVPPFRLVPATTTTQTIYEDRTRGGFFKRLFSSESGKNGIGGAFSYIFGGDVAQPLNSTETMVNAGRTAANFTWLDMSYGGRPGVQVPSALQQVKREKTIRFSGVKVAGTQVNGLSRWDALSQYDELPQEQGAVTRLSVADQAVSEGSILLANQTYGDESLALGSARIQTADNEVLVAISKQVIGGGNALRGGYGCTDPATVVAYGGKVFYLSRRRAEVLRYDRNGLVPLAETYKARQRLTSALADRPGPATACYDPRRKEYWLTLPASGEAPALTLVFSDRREAWADEVSAHPEAGAAVGNEMVSWQGGALWRHAPDAPANSFYGETTPTTLTFTVAAPAGIAKQFRDVAVESPGLWLATEVHTDTSLASSTRQAWFTYREGVWRTGLRRASNSPGFPTAARAVNNGLPLIGSRLTLTLTAPDQPTPLTACTISADPRSGQRMGV